MNRSKSKKDRPKELPEVTNSKNESEIFSTEKIRERWVTDGCWQTGFVGAAAVVLCAYIFYREDIYGRGLTLGPISLNGKLDTSIFALIFTATAMIGTEIWRLWIWDRATFFSISPLVKDRNYFILIKESLFYYIKTLILLKLAIAFYHSASEYGFQRGAEYYQIWFRFLEFAWHSWLWVGLPYTLITRALKHSTQADSLDTTSVITSTCKWLAAKAAGTKIAIFSDKDKKNLRGLIVKLFFAPIMTVFFLDQFPHLVNNISYVSNGLLLQIKEGSYSHLQFNKDLFNISITLIFTIDVALAWCGYVTSSRWIKNQTISAEPTMLGWVVCLLCYPPFQQFVGFYYSPPNEKIALGSEMQWVITLVTVMMVLSYLVYTASTLWFGVRFSNLTNRGIIRTGPYSLVRHPAYAAKNFSWYCIMLPNIVFNIDRIGLAVAIPQVIGLFLMSYLYYLRALTEERHLSADPCYREYCDNVKFRFIPGVL